MKKVYIYLISMILLFLYGGKAMAQSDWDKFPIVIERDSEHLPELDYFLLDGAFINESQHVTYTSKVYHFQKSLTKVRFTVKETGGNQSINGHTLFTLSSFEMFDENGNPITLTKDMIYSNADHNQLNPNKPDGGGIAALIDGDPSTYFHSAYKNAPAEHHYLEVTLPEGKYSSFSFSMTARSNGELHAGQFPAVLEIDGEVGLPIVTGQWLFLDTEDLYANGGVQDIELVPYKTCANNTAPATFAEGEDNGIVPTADGIHLPKTTCLFLDLNEEADLTNYTLIYDIKITDLDCGYSSLIQTNLNNNDDADLFIHQRKEGEEVQIGINGIGGLGYHGNMEIDKWYRIAVVVNEGIISLYINGWYFASSEKNNKWVINKEGMYLFLDNDGETSDVEISGIHFWKQALTDEEILLLGDIKGENGYVVTYILDDEVYYTDSVSAGRKILPPDAPIKEGYTLLWNGLPKIMPGYDVTTVGEYVINSYKVTYMAGSSVCHIDSVEYGGAIVAPDGPVREGYTFVEWEDIPETMPAKDITITGIYTVNTYKVTYMVDEEVYYTDSVSYGSVIMVPDTPVKEGHTFVRWNALPKNMPANDLTIIGEFSVNSYKVTYMIDNYVFHSEIVEYGTPITPPEAPTNPGYTFSGWSEYPETMPAQDLIITGTYFGAAISTIFTDEQGLIYNLNDEKDAYAVADVSGSIYKNIVIPNEVNGLPVTSIKEKAFISTDELQSVVIPQGITTVENKAFYGCSNLLIVEWNATAPVRVESFDKVANHGNMLVFVGDKATEVTYQGNVIIEDTADRIVLTDGLPFRNPRTFTARNISYSHNFTKHTKIGKASGWEALVLPFDVQTMTSEKKGALLPFGKADFTTSLPYWAAELQNDRTFAVIDDIKANTPFIMEVPNSDEYEDIYNVEGVVTFASTDVEVLPTTEQEPMSEGYTLVASYEGVASASGVYALNNEEYTADGETYMPGGVFVANSRDIRPFEAYVYTTNAGRAPYLRIGENGAADIILSTVNGQQTTEIYDLTGRKVLKTENLKGGIYIVNGRKVMVK